MWCFMHVCVAWARARMRSQGNGVPLPTLSESKRAAKMHAACDIHARSMGSLAKLKVGSFAFMHMRNMTAIRGRSRWIRMRRVCRGSSKTMRDKGGCRHPPCPPVQAVRASGWHLLSRSSKVGTPPHSPTYVKALCVWPCIGVRAGCKADGSIKLRVVYDLTASGVNEATIPTEKLHCDTLDAYFHLIWVAHEALGVGIWCFVGHVCWGMLLYFACLG